MDDNFTDNLTVKNLDLINVAYEEFRSKGLDTSMYKISVYYRDDKIVVIFHTEGKVPHIRGNISTSPSFEVVVDADEKKVLSSNFVR